MTKDINIMFMTNESNFPAQFILVRKCETYTFPVCDALIVFASVTATFKWAISISCIGLAESKTKSGHKVDEPG